MQPKLKYLKLARFIFLCILTFTHWLVFVWIYTPWNSDPTSLVLMLLYVAEALPLLPSFSPLHFVCTVVWNHLSSNLTNPNCYRNLQLKKKKNCYINFYPKNIKMWHINIRTYPSYINYFNYISKKKKNSKGKIKILSGSIIWEIIAVINVENID